MTLLPFLVLCLAAAGSGLLGLGPGGRRAAGLSASLLVAALLAALAMPPGTSPMGGMPLAVDGYLRLVAALGCAFAVGLTVLAAALEPRHHAAEGAPPALAAVPLVGALSLGAGALALAMGPADAALPAALVGGVGLFGLVALPRDPANVAAGRAVLRTAALAGALVMFASAAVLGAGNPLDGQPVAVGGAILVLAGAIGLRMGALPFHATVARLVPRAGLLSPLVLLWAAIPLVVSAIGVVASGISPLELPLGAERGLIALAAAATLVVAPIVAAMTDDLHHVVAYAIVTDMGLLLLAFAAGPPAWELIRTWLLISVTTKTALVAWSVAVRDTFGTVRLGDLHGWAIRAPVLAGALALVALATLGVPTFASAAVRREIADAVFLEPLASAAFAASLLAALPYLRLAAVGLSSPSPVVRRAPDERLRRPAAWLHRVWSRTTETAPATPPASGAGRPASDPGRGPSAAPHRSRDPDAERAAARVADIARKFAIGAGRSDLPAGARPRTLAGERARPAATGAEPRPPRVPRAPVRQRVARLRTEIGEAWHLNLVPVAAGVVLVLAATSFLVSVGLFSLRAGSAERLPMPLVPVPTMLPGASAAPSPTASLRTSPAASPAARPGASPAATPGGSGGS